MRSGTDFIRHFCGVEVIAPELRRMMKEDENNGD